MNLKNKKELLRLFSYDKQISQNQIELSIKKWKDVGLKQNMLFSIFWNKTKTIHWEQSKNIIGYYDINLIWSNSIIKTQINIKKKDVSTALEGIKNFYSNISTITPDLSHPDVLNCLNKTAEKNKCEQFKFELKEQIETDILDPFGGIIGFTQKNKEDLLLKHKNEALDIVNYSLEIFGDHYEKKSKIMMSTNKLKCFEVLDERNFIVNLYWNNRVIKSSLIKENNVRNKIIQYKAIIESFNIKRPNIKNAIIKKMYDLSLTI